MAATARNGVSFSTDTIAATIFYAVAMLAAIIAFTTTPTLRQYWRCREWGSAVTCILVLMVAAPYDALGVGGFTLKEITDAVAVRAEASRSIMMGHPSDDVKAAEAALEDAKKARDRECVKVGPICRQREETANQRQAALDKARTDARAAEAEATVKADAKADPQATAFGITSDRLSSIKAVLVIALCLLPGALIAIDDGLIEKCGQTS
jgi:hypothetical protein